MSNRLPFRERVTATVPDTLEAMDIGRTKFYELVNAGKVKVIKLDNRSLVVVESVLNLIQQLAA